MNKAITARLDKPTLVIAFIREIPNQATRDLGSVEARCLLDRLVEAGSRFDGPAWFPYKLNIKFSRK
jgi:hypothetical protein